MQPPTPQVTDPIPVRMCNELVFCPRLYHLEHVQGIFVESAATIEGSAQHRRAARKPLYRQRSDAPSPWSADLPRTLHFTSEAWGVSGQLDMIELTTGEVVPVEAKRGSAPSHEEHRWRGHDLRYRAWPADVAQLGLYMALLRDAGLPCHEGRIFYRRNRTLVTIAWSRELELVLREVVAQAQSVRSQVTAPPPLEDSPKCVGCSLHGVCLPDEYFALSRAREPEQPPIRRIIPGRDDRAILHVAVPGTTVRKQGESLFVCPRDDEDQRIPMKDIAHVAMFGRFHLTEPCLQHLLTRGISISHHTGAGYLVGFSSALGTRNIALRRAQFAAADNPTRSLEVARSLVYAKIRNQRTVIRRHRVTQDHEADDGIEFADALSRMQVALRNVKEADNIDALRGYEGEAAAHFAQAFLVGDVVADKIVVGHGLAGP